MNSAWILLTVGFAFLTIVIFLYQLEEKKYHIQIVKGIKYKKLQELNEKYIFNDYKEKFIYGEFFDKLNKYRINTLYKTINNFKNQNYNEILETFYKLKENQLKYSSYLEDYDKIMQISITQSSIEKGLAVEKYLKKEALLLKRLKLKPSLTCRFDLYFYYRSPKGRSTRVSDHYKVVVELINDPEKKINELFTNINSKFKNDFETIEDNEANEKKSLRENFIKEDNKNDKIPIEKSKKIYKTDDIKVVAIFKINILGKVALIKNIRDKTIHQEIKENKFKEIAEEDFFNKFNYLEKFLNDFDYLETGEQFINHAESIKLFYKDDSRFEINLENITKQSPDELVRFIKIDFGIFANFEVYIKSIKIGKNDDIDGYLEINNKSKLNELFETIQNEIIKINNSLFHKRLDELQNYMIINSSSRLKISFTESTEIVLNIFISESRNNFYSLKYESYFLNQKEKIEKSLFQFQSIDTKPLDAFEMIKESLNSINKNQPYKKDRLLLKLAYLREKFPNKNRVSLNFSKEILESNVWFIHFDKKPDVMPLNIEKLAEGSHLINKKISEQMRDYQKYAFKWLSKLVSNGISGILADDMGLGKSLEIISIIEADKVESPNLIVCPLSVTHNWLNEFFKWAPSEIVKILNSDNKIKFKNTNHSGKTTYIVSYEFLSNNFEMFSDLKFNFIILDEAQYIKNENTKRSKTVKRLQSINRFALTGTPIENKEEDLWSIFEFLSPKLFEIYKIDLLSKENKRLYIKPFILRRKKTDVLKELPDKNEILTTLDMTKKQKETYDYYESMWVDYKDDPVKLLALLIRLRQICITPKLIEEKIKSDSCKLIHLSELIDSIKNSNESVLIFSSFTKTFPYIEEILELKKINYLKLTGKLKGKKRTKIIQEFQDNNDIKVFLISLKAGGIGINLTKANNVVFLDPWWNKSVENQAADRVHRIGQERKVNVYKLICAETIEEKVLSIQKEKIEIMKYFIDNDNDNPLGQLSLDLIQKLFNKRNL
jgi:SNF2 family DNA or RNA helicase